MITNKYFFSFFLLAIPFALNAMEKSPKNPIVGTVLSGRGFMFHGRPVASVAKYKCEATESYLVLIFIAGGTLSWDITKSFLDGKITVSLLRSRTIFEPFSDDEVFEKTFTEEEYLEAENLFLQAQLAQKEMQIKELQERLRNLLGSHTLEEVFQAIDQRADSIRGV